MFSRSFFCICLAIGGMSAGLYGADEAFGDMESYLPKEAKTRGTYSPGKELDRFRSYARFDKAYRLIKDQQLERAKQELRTLLEQSPENWRAWSMYLPLLYRTSDYGELIEQANLALKRQPYFIPALLYRGQAYAAIGRLPEAEADLEALSRQPELLVGDRIAVLETLSDVYLRAKAYPLAISTSDRVLQVRPGYQAWFREGLAFDYMNRPEDAERAYRQSLQFADSPMQRMAALGAQAEALRKTKQWAPAKEALEHALQIAPDDTTLLRTLAETEYQLRIYSDAERQLRHLLAVRPNTQDREFLANILLLRKDWRNAEAEFTALLAAGIEPADQAKAYRALSVIEESRGNFAPSAEYLNRALRIEPSISDREKLANLLAAQGNFSEADQVLAALIKQASAASDKHRLLLALGEVRMSGKQYAAAAQAFNEAAKIKNDAVTLASASNAEEQAGDIAAAIELSRQAALRNPSVETHVRLGTLYEKHGDLRLAIEHLEKAAKESATPHEKAAIYRRMAFASAREGNHAQAVQWFEQALAIGEDDAAVHSAVAESLTQLRRFSEAADHFRQAVAIIATVTNRRALANAEEKAGELDAAVSTYSDLLREFPQASADRVQICASLGEIEAKRGHHERAADWWKQAAEAGFALHPEYLESAGQSLVLAERWQQAADIFNEYLTVPELPSENRAHALETLGFISSKLGNDEAAAEYFQHAIETGAARDAVHDDLGFTFYRMARWRQALDAFLAASSSDRNPQRLIAIARCYQKLVKPGLAIHFIEQALESEEELPVAERRQAYADLGFLYNDNHDYPAALEAWQHAQRLENRPALALSIARLKRTTGDAAAAQKELQDIHADQLPQKERAGYFDELAQVYSQQGKLEDSRRAWEAANRIEPSTVRSYQIGLAYFNNGQAAEAIPFLARAAKESSDPAYLQALAYAYKSAGRAGEAVDCFEQVAALKPGSVDVFKELGYLEMHRSHNSSAARWFREALDAGSGARGAQGAAAVFDSSEGLREDLSRLTNRFDVVLYDGFSDHQATFSTPQSPASGANNLVPAGGGIEIAYQPPVIGFRNERVLQVFVRGVWNNQPDSLAFQRGSEQMGVGLRYKPLISQNLQLSVERLIPLGSGVQPNWMARAMSSWNSNLRLRPAERAWNYSVLFVDFATLLRAPHVTAQLAQYRQGITFRAGQQVMITPLVVATAKHQSPQSAVGTYLEAGAGLSLRFVPYESSYSHRLASNFEVLADCHKGALVAQPGGQTYDGCRAAGILRF